MNFDEALALAASSPSTQPGRAPKGFEPGLSDFVDGRPTTIVTPPMPEYKGDADEVAKTMGITLPDGYALELVEARFDPAAWHRDNQGDDAVTRPAWRYKFRVVAATRAALFDIDALAKEARGKRPLKEKTPKHPNETFVVALSDLQIGKSSSGGGGTRELLERLDVARRAIAEKARRLRPAQIVLADPGDLVENFYNVASQDRTNDLSLTQQLRLARRVIFDFVDALAPHTPDLIVAGVPSNHGSVRKTFKGDAGEPGDDYGIETIYAVSDICAANPERYGHVTFATPPDHQEWLGLTLVGGRSLAIIHGHQKRNPNALEQLLEGHAAGRTSLGLADVVIMGHWHHLEVRTWGQNNTFFICPAFDPGSDWYTSATGRSSRGGILTIIVDEEGWRDLEIFWAPKDL